MDFSPESLRKQWKLMTAKSDAIEAKLAPLREELNDTVSDDSLTQGEARAREAKLRPQIKKLQAELYPIEMERAAIARALGGKTGIQE